MSNDVLQELIQNNNPFAEYTIRTQDIWGKEFLDEPSLNSHASDAVFKCIEQLESRQINVMGITLRAEKGVGKVTLLAELGIASKQVVMLCLYTWATTATSMISVRSF